MQQPADTTDYEMNRINQLQERYLYMQKKTFTKWMNSFLSKAKLEVNDIFVDLSDGKKLLKLLEILSGEHIAKPATGQMRVHKIETMNRCLHFLKEQNVKIGNIGAEDIVDSNQKLILGLLWSIILRFHIKDIEVYTSESDADEESERQVKKEETEPKPKQRLLLWSQKRIRGYPHVDVQDFSKSWRDGMAFNALIHSHNPEMIDYASLNPENHLDNLNNAFTVARDKLDIEPLLDAEDVDTDKPDEHSILTYVSSFYHAIANDGFNSTEEPKIKPKQVVEQQIEPQIEASSAVEVETLVDDVDGMLKAALEVEDEIVPELSPEIQVEPKVESTIKSEVNGANLPVTEQPDKNNLFIWVIVVAVGLTILRNLFQNTTNWFMSNPSEPNV